jgi:hypothetical protein
MMAKFFLALAIVVGGGWLVSLWTGNDPPTPKPERAATAQAPAKTSQEIFLAMNADMQRQFLALAIAAVGKACKVNRHTFKGLDKEGSAFHLAECENGDAHLVTLPADADADLVVLDCEIAAAVGADCFAPW